MLLDDECHPLVVDLGAVRPVGASADGHAGTAGYAAPELLDHVVSPSLDLFGLGALLYAALVGEPPPGPGADPAAARGDLPSWVADLVRDLLSPSPGSRPAGAALTGLFGAEAVPSRP
ncbi:MAG: hypothetical protein ABMB14_30180, partial [Myxococcota bacterium]